MVPLVDMHCHLLAGLDDGPRTMEAALEMCAIAHADGVRLMAATAHQNPRWREVTPDRIRIATTALQVALHEQGSAMTVFPCAEVMAQVDTLEQWKTGRLLSVADQGRFLLLEMPRVFVDLLPTVRQLREAGVRPILAHPEREEVLLHEPGLIEELIEAGALVQISAESVTRPKSRNDLRALRAWCRRGIVHLLGSDGHAPHKRTPHLAQAFERLTRWVGAAEADRIGSSNGLAVVHGLPVRVRRPLPAREASWWFLQMW